MWAYAPAMAQAESGVARDTNAQDTRPGTIHYSTHTPLVQICVSFYYGCAARRSSVIEHLPFKQRGGGSSPPGGASCGEHGVVVCTASCGLAGSGSTPDAHPTLYERCARTHRHNVRLRTVLWLQLASRSRIARAQYTRLRRSPISSDTAPIDSSRAIALLAVVNATSSLWASDPTVQYGFSAQGCTIPFCISFTWAAFLSSVFSSLTFS